MITHWKLTITYDSIFGTSQPTVGLESQNISYLNIPKDLVVNFTYKILPSFRTCHITVYLYNSYINSQLLCSSFPTFSIPKNKVIYFQ